VFNILAILGLTAVIVPIPVPADLSMLDLGLVAGTALLLIGALTLGRIGRGMGLLFLAVYAAYIGWLALNAA
jgi:cation:H+ antiporter